MSHYCKIACAYFTILRVFGLCLAGFLYIANAGYHPADTDQDWKISQTEINRFVASWRKGESDLADTVRGIYIQQSGESYHVDNELNEPLCWAPSQTPIIEDGVNRALLVGLNHYLHPGNDLVGCVNDMIGIRDYLLLPDENWSEDKITMLLDEQATLTAVRSKMQELARVSQPGDTVIFAKSGHGGQNYGTSTYICAYDDYYEDYQLAEDLALFNTEVKIVLIIDACHSGGMFKGNTKSSSLLFAESVMRHYYDIKAKNAKGNTRETFTDNIAFMTAADYDELSHDQFEWFNKKYGEYIGRLLQASFISSADINHDGRFQLIELHQFAAENVPLENWSQHPQYLNGELLNSISVKGNLGNIIEKNEEMPVVRQTIDGKLISVAVTSVDSVHIWGLEMTLPQGVSPQFYTEEPNAYWDKKSNRLTWWGKESTTLAISVLGQGVQGDLQTRANGDGAAISIDGDLTLVLPLEEEPQNNRYHSADFNQDGRISMEELLSVIRLYLYESNHQRTGEYHADPSTADGFAPGPDNLQGDAKRP